MEYEIVRALWKCREKSGLVDRAKLSTVDSEGSTSLIRGAPFVKKKYSLNIRKKMSESAQGRIDTFKTVGFDCVIIWEDECNDMDLNKILGGVS